MISHILVVVLTLLHFFIEGQCQSFIRFYLPEIISKKLEIKNVDFSASYEITQLFRGRPLDTLGFDRLLFHSYEQSTICDVFRSASKPRLIPDQDYYPYLCVEDKECSGHDVISLRDLPCSFYLKRGVCCHVTNITFYKQRFGHDDSHNVLNYLELPTLGGRFFPAFMYANLDTATVEKEELHSALENSKFLEELKSQTLCGVYIITDGTPNSKRNYSPFFCVPENYCGTTPNSPKNHNPKEEWKQFCTNVHWYTGTTTKESPYPKCCHAADIKDVFSQNWLTKWELPQVPLNINFAPGVRSSYMCEHYSQYACIDTFNYNDTNIYCAEPSGHTGTGKVARREAPHKASLGIIAPFTLTFHCLGTLISRYFILSTWHCSSMRGIATNMAHLGEDIAPRIYPGEEYDERIYVISEIIYVMDNWEKHADGISYVQTRGFGGLALFRTSSPVFFNSYMRPACLFYNSRPKPKDGLFFGYERYYAVNSSSETFYDLRKIHIYIDEADPEKNQIKKESPNCYKVTDDLRKQRFFDMTQSQYSNVSYVDSQHWDIFCGSKTDVDIWTLENLWPCRNDRGGALVTKLEFPICSWLVYGVLFNYRDCGADHPTTFFNVSMYLDPIEDIVWPYPFLDFASPTDTCYDSSADPSKPQFMWKSEFKSE